MDGGRLVRRELGEDRVESLNNVRVPVMNIAGDGDRLLAPASSVAHLSELVPNAPSIRMESAPGGHLGVLVGRGARDTTWRYLSEFLTSAT